MRLEGSLCRDGRLWLAEVPDLDLVTQGRSRREACAMLKDAIELLVDRPGFKAAIIAAEPGRMHVGASNGDMLLALLLRRQRQKYGLTLREVARRMRSNSVNAFARYEQGRARPALAKLEQLLSAISPKLEVVISLPA